MTSERRIKNLAVPTARVDVVLDTDAYNEIDDQFAIAYMLKCSDRINVKGICAAPFYNSRAKSVADGMEQSYNEIVKLLNLMQTNVDVYRGSTDYLADENTPVISDAAKLMAELARSYSPEHPLYIVAIGAITNVASAFLLNPEMKENVVVVWLGGHALHYHDNKEFNMEQDVAAARVVMSSGVPFVQLPCNGVVDNFRISKPELLYWLRGKGALADYLADAAIAEADSYAEGTAWTRVIWDVTTVAWLLNDGEKFMQSRIIPTTLPGYDDIYEKEAVGYPMAYVYHIERDALMNDLIEKITK